MENIALLVDTASRRLNVSAVAVTETANGLVLRFGSLLGTLEDLTRDGEMKDFNLPIIVGTKGYLAQSSCGFVCVFAGYAAGEHARIVGVQGMPWQRRKGLAVLAEPQTIVVLRPGTSLIPVATGAETANPEGYRRHHSNAASKEAALEGLRLRAQTHPREVVLAEGQSDYCHGWRLVGFHEIYDSAWKAEWPAEHRPERFTDEALAEAAARSAAWRQVNQEDCDRTWEESDRLSRFREILGLPAEEEPEFVPMASDKKAKGWRRTGVDEIHLTPEDFLPEEEEIRHVSHAEIFQQYGNIGEED